MPSKVPINLTQALPRLRWFLAWAQRALGLWGVLALVMIVAALSIQQGVIRTGRKDNALRLQEALAGIAAKPENVKITEPPALHLLPAAAAFLPRLEKVLAILQKNGFAVDEANYRYATIVDNQTQRLGVEIPLSGTYLSLREAVDDLSQQPGVRIDNLSMERKSIGAQQMAIGLKLSLLGVRK